MGRFRLPDAWREALAFARRRRPVSVPRRKVRVTLLAQLEGFEDSHVDLLRELASQGEQFEHLIAVPEWAALIELKEEMQAIATERTRASTSSDAERREGAGAYWAIEGLFGAVYRTIHNGQKARQVLRSAVKQT